MPSDHRHVLANVHKATPEVVAEAVRVAQVRFFLLLPVLRQFMFYNYLWRSDCERQWFGKVA
jgi:hypothetical protein